MPFPASARDETEYRLGEVKDLARPPWDCCWDDERLVCPTPAKGLSDHRHERRPAVIERSCPCLDECRVQMPGSNAGYECRRQETGHFEHDRASAKDGEDGRGHRRQLVPSHPLGHEGVVEEVAAAIRYPFDPGHRFIVLAAEEERCYVHGT